MTETIELGMSNLDHKIDAGLAEALRAAPNEAVAHHAAWEFSGYVSFNGTEFVEVVWRHHAVVDTVSAPTLEELMSDVNDKWGWE